MRRSESDAVAQGVSPKCLHAGRYGLGNPRRRYVELQARKLRRQFADHLRSFGTIGCCCGIVNHQLIAGMFGVGRLDYDAQIGELATLNPKMAELLINI